jgi:hypothetical protein
MHHRMPRRVALGATLGLALALVGQSGLAAAATPIYGVAQTTCAHHGATGYTQGFVTVTGSFSLPDQWSNIDVFNIWDACGSSAPYGSYPVSSTKSITEKFTVDSVNLASCEGGFPDIFKCTVTVSSTSASYTASGGTHARDQELWFNTLQFPNIPGTVADHMVITGKNTFMGNTYIVNYYQNW